MSGYLGAGAGQHVYLWPGVRSPRGKTSFKLEAGLVAGDEERRADDRRVVHPRASVLHPLPNQNAALHLVGGPLSTVRTDNAPKVRFSATLGKEPEVELALV